MKDIRSYQKKINCSKEEYSNILLDAIASKYKKTDKHTAANINKEGIKHAREANIIDSFFTLKNLEGNFLNTKSCQKQNRQNRQTHITKHKYNFI